MDSIRERAAFVSHEDPEEALKKSEMGSNESMKDILGLGSFGKGGRICYSCYYDNRLQSTIKKSKDSKNILSHNYVFTPFH